MKTNSHQHLLWLTWSWRWWYISLRTAQANWWVRTSGQTVLCHIMATLIRYRTNFDRLKNLTRHFVHAEPFNIFDLFRRKFGRPGGLNFRTVKVGPCERRQIRPMPCERNPREDTSNCIITKLRFLKLRLCSLSFADEDVSCSEIVNGVQQV